MKKLLAFTLAMLIVFTLMSGCTSTTSSTPGGTATGDPSQAASGDDPATSDTPIPIKLLIRESEGQTLNVDTVNYKYIQEILLEKFNVDYSLETVVASSWPEFETQIIVRFASGADLPDIVNYGFVRSPDKMIDLYNNGRIIRLNDLIDEYGQDYKKNVLDSQPYIKATSSDADGNILRIPSIFADNPQQVTNFVNIRYDWLTKYDLEQPTTPDELYNCLKTFRDNDANGNGKNDEVFTAWNQWELYDIMGSAFGVIHSHESNDSWCVDENGKTYNSMLTDNYKDMLTFLNKLYSEKLLDQEYINLTWDAFQERIYNNVMSGEVGAWYDSVVWNMMATEKGVTGVNFIPIMPPISADNNPFVYNLGITGSRGYMITDSCKNPAAAMQVINYGFTEEGSRVNYYGTIDGNEYYVKPTETNGLVLAPYVMEGTNKVTEAIEADPLWMDKQGINREFIGKALITTVDDVVFEATQPDWVSKSPNQVTDRDFITKGLTDAVTTYARQPFCFANPTEEQSEKWSDYADLWTYMNEMVGKFVTGQEPLENWDKFSAQCESMGIADATAIMQARYEAYEAMTK